MNNLLIPACPPSSAAPVLCRSYEPRDLKGRFEKSLAVSSHVLGQLFGNARRFLFVWFAGYVIGVFFVDEKWWKAAFFLGPVTGTLAAAMLLWALLLFTALLGKAFGMIAWIGSTSFGSLLILIGGLKKSAKEFGDLFKQGRETYAKSFRKR